MSIFPLIAATYFMVSGGPYGIEDIFGGAGFGAAIVILLILPFIWSLPTTLMIGELASAIPAEGGFYVWVRRAMGPFWGYQEGWLSMSASIFDMALYPSIFVLYLSKFKLLSAYSADLSSGWIHYSLMFLVVVICSVWNLRGAPSVGRGAVALFFLLLAPFGVLVALGLWHGFTLHPVIHWTEVHTQAGLSTAILVAMWNYMGWDNASTIAGDVRNAPRTYSRALLISLLLVVATYIAPILAVAHARVPLSAWETGSWVTLAALFGGPRLALFMTAAAVAAALSTFNALVLSLSRLPYAMARDGFLPHAFARENRHGAPWVAIVVCSLLWACAMGLGFERTVMLDVLLTGLSILLEFAALISLRITEPDLPRPFRVPGGAAGLVLISAPPAILIIISCARNHAERIGSFNALTVGAAIVLAGVIVYFLGPRRHAAA
jgi:amino acid transporter